MLTLFGVSVIIFVVMRILPGGPLVAMFGMEGFMKLSDADRARLMEDLGCSDPLLVVIRHTLPNALLPIIILSGILMGFVLGRSVAIEQAFGVPGLGRTLVTAVIERDIIVAQNLVFLYGNIFILINVMVDLSYA